MAIVFSNYNVSWDENGNIYCNSINASAGIKLLTSEAVSAATSGIIETDLFSYSLPANTLKTDGDFIVYKGSFNSPGDASAIKTLRAYLGSVIFPTHSYTNSSELDYVMQLTITRINSTTAVFVVELLDNGASPQILINTPTVADFNTAQTFKITGQTNNASYGISNYQSNLTRCTN